MGSSHVLLSSFHTFLVIHLFCCCTATLSSSPRVERMVARTQIAINSNGFCKTWRMVRQVNRFGSLLVDALAKERDQIGWLRERRQPSRPSGVARQVTHFVSQHGPVISPAIALCAIGCQLPVQRGALNSGGSQHSPVHMWLECKASPQRALDDYMQRG